MKVLIIGAGRMGQRHAMGALSVEKISEVIITDINSEALDNAQNALKLHPNSKKAKYLLNRDYFKSNQKTDVVIIASTASNRIDLCEKVVALNPSHILLEKPLGQSVSEVKKLMDFFGKHAGVNAYVNLNMRMYPSFIKLKNDIDCLPQFKGVTEVTINTGTIGIGANGIHYIDLMRFLFNADTIEMEAAGIDELVIPSGRGPQFCDFGGWCIMNYKSNYVTKARVLYNLSSHSTVFGTMNFTFPHARVIVDEFEQKRYNKYRKADSTMPIQRYAADYLPQEEDSFVSPELKLLTEAWLNDLSEGKKSCLPLINEAWESHKAMFDWLKKSKTHKDIFPIT